MTQQELDQLQGRLNTLSKQNNEMVSVLEKNNLIKYPKVMVGVPILAWTHEFALSFLRFWTELITQPATRKFQIGFEFRYRRPVDLAEQELADLAIESGCTHLLLMDDDIYDVTANDLFTLLEADKEVIGGIMFTSGFPHAMCAFRRFDITKKVKEQPLLKESTRLYEIPQDQRNGIQHVDLIPFGFTLIKTSVFNKVGPRPWFKCDTKAPTDSHFADLCHDNGIEYFAHFGVWLNHRGVRIDNVHLQSQLGMLEAQRQRGRCIPLSPEEMAKQEQMVQTKMSEAEENYKKEMMRRTNYYELSPEHKVAQLIPKGPDPIPPIPQDQELKLANESYKSEITRRNELFSKNNGSAIAALVP